MTTPTSTATGHLPAQRRPALQELAGALRGELALPGTEAYGRLAAAFNTAVELSPLAVVVAADAYAVARAVRIASRHGLRVGVQCTGHAASTAMHGAARWDRRSYLWSGSSLPLQVSAESRLRTDDASGRGA